MKLEIAVENKTIECTVQFGNRKKISIHIEPFGLITVKAPKAASQEMIIRTVEQHGKWLLDKLHNMEQLRESLKIKPKEYQDSGKFPLLGKEYFLHELIETDGLNEDELKRNLKKFYILKCKKIMGERVAIYQKQLRVKPKTIEVVESANKWGSCSSDKNLTFNYRLAMAPNEVIDYVVIHELCHLNHMNHDRSFWRLIGSIMPDYKEKQAYLERFGGTMTL